MIKSMWIGYGKGKPSSEPLMRLLIYLFILFIFSCHSDGDREEYLSIKDHKIHTKISGEGETILLIHGGYLNLDMWEPQVNFLNQAGFQIIRYSDIGHGKTVDGVEPVLGYKIINQIIDTYVEGHELVTLVGLSWGAMLAVDYTLNHPERVKKMILVSPGLNGWNYFQDSLAAKNNRLRQIATSENDTAHAVDLFHQNWVVGPRRKKEGLASKFLSESRAMIDHTMKNHWQSDWSKLDSIQAINRLDEIKVPTYIIIGSEDAEDILLISEVYKEKITTSKVEKIEGVAHLLTMENPAMFNKRIIELIK